MSDDIKGLLDILRHGDGYDQRAADEITALRERLEQAERERDEANSKAIEWHDMWSKASTQGFHSGIEAAAKAVEGAKCNPWATDVIRALSPTETTPSVAEAARVLLDISGDDATLAIEAACKATGWIDPEDATIAITAALRALASQTGDE